MSSINVNLTELNQIQRELDKSRLRLVRTQNAVSSVHVDSAIAARRSIGSRISSVRGSLREVDHQFNLLLTFLSESIQQYENAEETIRKLLSEMKDFREKQNWWDWVGDQARAVGNAASDAWEAARHIEQAIVDALNDYRNQMFDAIREGIAAMMKWIDNVRDRAIAKGANLIEQFFKSDVLKGIVTTVGGLLKLIIDVSVDMGRKVNQYLSGKGTTLIDKMAADISRLPDQIKDIFARIDAVFSELKAKFQGVDLEEAIRYSTDRIVREIVLSLDGERTRIIAPLIDFVSVRQEKLVSNEAKRDTGSSSWWTYVNLGLDMIPFVGTAKGIYEVVSGEDLMGNKLSTSDRIIAGVGTVASLIPGGKVVVKGAGKWVTNLFKGADEAIGGFKPSTVDGFDARLFDLGPPRDPEVPKITPERQQQIQNLRDGMYTGESRISEGTPKVNKTFVDTPFDEAGNLKPNVKYKAGEHQYDYETDNLGRIEKFSTDELMLTAREERLPHDSNTPGKEPGDHAGHLAGDRFGGSPEIDNLVSQSSKVNLSQYKKIENQWAKAIEEGKHVKVNVEIKYDGDSMRPSEFIVQYEIDGKFMEESILN
ncbi:DNA/RNA non-specific endonuclease [Paenibacillus xylaniclasticus]|uniref:DNA/RNA non-specific endonuclease n=1 Tax=Paenibacillus xylaniclasticus TaxID=588083 RepID=UPI000FD71904|nr:MULTISPECIES: DNA/RNA non-specific endonuclease [Paenibacillus]GFN31598.1 hypothetical protein PCURB6_18580 [Paenibacillus curdlanolyticus]